MLTEMKDDGDRALRELYSTARPDDIEKEIPRVKLRGLQRSRYDFQTNRPPLTIQTFDEPLLTNSDTYCSLHHTVLVHIDVGFSSKIMKKSGLLLG